MKKKVGGWSRSEESGAIGGDMRAGLRMDETLGASKEKFSNMAVVGCGDRTVI